MVTQCIVLQLLYEHEKVALFLFFCLTDVKDTKYYMPTALEQTDMCSACPACCVYDNTTATTSSTETTSADDNAVTETTSADADTDSGCVMSYTTAAWLVVSVCHLIVL